MPSHKTEMEYEDYIDLSSDYGEDSEEDGQFEEEDLYDDENEIQPRFGGYEYEFVDEVSQNQKCPVCLLPMRDAVQTSDCGHRFCRDCLQQIVRSDHPVCPNDRQEIEEEGGFFTDKAWTRDILSLRVKCQQSARGCDWIGELRHAEEHQNDCPYEDTQCSGCDDSVQRRLLQIHLDEECPKRIVACTYCQDEFYFIQKQEHEDTYCKRFPLDCENKCGQKGIPRGEDKRAYLIDHIDASVDDHLEMTWSALVDTKQELNGIIANYDGMKDLQQSLLKSLGDCKAEIRNLSQEVENLKIVNAVQNKKIKEMERKNAKETATKSKVSYHIPAVLKRASVEIPNDTLGDRGFIAGRPIRSSDLYPEKAAETRQLPCKPIKVPLTW
ncbi:TNF receptor-associated factor 6-like isoform X2 [Montipora capricornis]|uniref:TNF receptor-associated factor 6-like isoform X2 n=1 Tax=Montipora capricornis TaxID=246305 RepID=UPI0035F13261